MHNRIAWLVPYPIKGSGGHRTIFSHIRNLSEKGYECHVYIGEDQNYDMNISTLRDVVEGNFGPCPAHIHAGYDVSIPYDMALATAWWTAEIVANQVNAKHKVYFVQDFEPWFNQMGDLYIQAENSYKLGITPLTIGRWLSHLLKDHYGSKSCYFDFTADNTIYYPLPGENLENAVCFIYQPEKARRCCQIGRDALAIVKHHFPEVNIYTYGSIEKPDFSFEHNHLGILSLEGCNRLYNKCVVGLCLSSSNPSRVPFEMMAAGLPAVDFYGDNTIYDMPDHGVLLAERNPSSLAGAIIKILKSSDLKNKMRQVGLSFMEKRYAELEFEQCASKIEQILAGEPLEDEIISPLYKSAPFIADYSIPPSIQSIIPVVPGIEISAQNGFFKRLSQNRIGRVMKVLWKGYY